MGREHLTRVNAIAIQAKVENPQSVNPMSSLQKTKKRSISTEPLMLPAYNVGKRAGPPQVRVKEVDTRDAVQLAKKKKLVWLPAPFLAQSTKQSAAGLASTSSAMMRSKLSWTV